MSSPDDSAVIQIENSTIMCSKVKKLLRAHVDYKLKFDIHIQTIYEKGHRKLSALWRLTNYMDLPKRSILMNALFKAQFNYYLDELLTALLFGCFTAAV